MLERQMLHGLLSRVRDGRFAVTYWDGTTERYGDGEPFFTLVLKDAGVVDEMKSGVEKAFYDAYIAGRIEVEGDLEEMVATSIRNASLARGWMVDKVLQAIDKGAKLRRRSLKKQKQDIASHYDLGNDFFRMWLDESMTYSCAYFHTPEDALEQAQRQKVEHSLKKLRLKRGETMLDIGSGWGSAILKAGSQYGVKALGITLSEEQHRATQDAICRRGLEDCVDVRLVNYLELEKEGQTFDKILSIGMIEHVGKAHLDEFASATARMLKPGGIALLHHITSPHVKPGVTPEEDSFSERIFPGGYIPTLSEMTGHLLEHGLLIQDVENLRPHYAMTLRNWANRYEAHIDEVKAMYSEEFSRLWRLYLRGTCASFREGSLEIHQILVSNGIPNDLPLTRADLYA